MKLSENKSLVERIARAFWRRIDAYKNDYEKELPEELPVEFASFMATALSQADDQVLLWQTKDEPEDGGLQLILVRGEYQLASYNDVQKVFLFRVDQFVDYCHLHEVDKWTALSSE